MSGSVRYVHTPQDPGDENVEEFTPRNVRAQAWVIADGEKAIVAVPVPEPRRMA